jgi:hypothetical protein
LALASPRAQRSEIQSPATQADSVPKQTSPQAPQCAGSSRVSTQAPSHFVIFESQVTAQAPALHFTLPPAGAVQVLAQPPQLAASLCVFTHLPEHSISFFGHSATQVPALQRALPPAGALHCLPQAPQFFGSVAVFTHAPLQSVVLASQSGTQAPAVQTSPLAHFRLQAPQWLLSIS